METLYPSLNIKVSMATKSLYPRAIKYYKHYLEHPILMVLISVKLHVVTSAHYNSRNNTNEVKV